MKRWLVGIIGGLFAIGAITVVFGSIQPREHRATSRVTLRAPAESVWTVVRDIATLGSWWPEVTGMTPVKGAGGQERWLEEMGGMVLPITVEDIEPGRRFRTVIDSVPGAEFGGTWTYEVLPVAGGTDVRLTEDGWVRNPLFRAVMRITGPHSTMDSYLTALGKRFGEDLRPEHETAGP